MENEQNKTPLYDALLKHFHNEPISFHVPGHKFGEVFNSRGLDTFKNILSIDATEITGLDDLHGADGVIEEAQKLASAFFNSDDTRFLVNGSTSGNLASIMAVCRPGDKVIVQRNSHKSILHGIELANAQPVFLMPEHEEETQRYSRVTVDLVQEALSAFPEAKAVILTYPDYFGRAYDIQKIIEVVHRYEIPVIVDEAHGVHFTLGSPFPISSLDAGADVVIQSAHKMAPAMTMASFLHSRDNRVDKTRLSYYLQLFQSSSPSYPLLASLDLARHFLSAFGTHHKKEILEHVSEVKEVLKDSSYPFEVLPAQNVDDPLKITLQTFAPWTGFEVAKELEEQEIHPELATSDQVLLTVGLRSHIKSGILKERLERVKWQLKNELPHGTIEAEALKFKKLQTLDIQYEDLQHKTPAFIDWRDASGRICAESVIPYPPGIPLIMKGERIKPESIDYVHVLLRQNARFQNERIGEGIWVY
ncbi:aminotransferase class I/II-fold pyridoxal phosphate-dependent enzyme [Halobacillus campisalis]|uniref:Aminotransferase class I/II-fold pyridoxal phosphate-dependent enzyme n=1 Tax=Halobacillus campisalis TaxID=435909 RepID=A0ABW2K827_9BACI|nr:aminotransferase class I/II-fold pyridoxal phosphate-dependent enzyme [Halobacillus campisalis]